MLSVTRTPPRRAAAVPPGVSAPRRLPPLLRRAWYGLNQAFRRRLAGRGLTPDQFTILRWLIEAGPAGLTQRELAELMCSDANTITSLLDRMQARGLVARQPHESDRRANRIRPRPAGRRLCEKLRPIAVGLQEEVLAALTDEQQAQLLEGLALLGDACQAAAVRSPLPPPLGLPR
jgi:DNA-binding MarR family transcriptional regulator